MVLYSDNKSGIQDNSDQRIHVDYPNHTLAHPTPWDCPDAVEMIVYFDDFEETGGGTAVVPRQGPDAPAYRDNQFLERLIAESSLRQRAVLGFPQSGNDYWTPETIEAVEARYGMFGMDMVPYGHMD